MSSSKRSVKRAAIIMFLYAIVVFAVSLLAYLIAPPGANAATAVASGGTSAVLMCVMAGLSLMIHKNRTLGMIGIHVGMVLPLVLAGVFLWRMPIAYRDSGVHRYFQNAFAEKVADGALQDTDEARTAFFAESEDQLAGAEIPRTDKAYAGLTLTLLFGASSAAFVLLLLSRPSVPKQADADPFGEQGAAKTDTERSGKDEAFG